MEGISRHDAASLASCLKTMSDNQSGQICIEVPGALNVRSQMCLMAEGLESPKMKVAHEIAVCSPTSHISIDTVRAPDTGYACRCKSSGCKRQEQMLKVKICSAARRLSSDTNRIQWRRALT